MVWVLGDNNVARAPLSEDFREEQPVTAGLETDDDAHRFPLAGEGDHFSSTYYFHNNL